MFENPVLRKELFLRLRIRQMSVLSRWIGSITAGILISWIYISILRWVFTDASSRTGSDVWSACIVLQVAITCLLAPAVAANSITQEKEQQTWDMLIFTRLTPQEIVFGKLIARYAVLIFINMLFMPIQLAGWMRSPHDVTFLTFGLTEMLLLISGLFFTTFGLFMSWLLNRTLFAIMCSYSFVVGGLIIITSLITAMLSFFAADDMFTKSPLMWLNPVMMTYEAMNPHDNANTVFFLAFGLLSYLILTALLVWRMVVGFRRFALMA